MKLFDIALLLCAGVFLVFAGALALMVGFIDEMS